MYNACEKSHKEDAMTRTNRALTVLALSLALATGTTAVAVASQPTPPAVQDQNDRLLSGLEAGAAARAQAAVEQVRAGERNFDLAPVVTIAPQPVPAAAGRGLDPLAVLLIGLVGGLAGGAAAMAGWTATKRRHAHRVVAA
jgi:hypothetical protein